MNELKLTTRLDLPCGCSEEYSFGEGEIVYFIEHEDKQLDKELFGFWLQKKIGGHICVATTQDIERYLLTAIKFAYPYPWFERQPDYNNDYLRNLVEVFAYQEGKRIV